MSTKLPLEEMIRVRDLILAGGQCPYCTRDGGDHDGECEYDCSYQLYDQKEFHDPNYD